MHDAAIRQPNNAILRAFALLLTAASMCGCWTFNESPYPETEVSQAPNGTNITVGVTGFAATLTEYATVHEYRTVYVPGYVGRRYARPGHYETVPSIAYIPQLRTTDIFLRRARDNFEKAGYAVAAATPDWTVDVEFAGPVKTDADMMKQLAWVLGTVFFCDWDTVTWTAKLRVRDNRTGRLVFHRDYSQRYETNVFGLIPLFGISSCRTTSAVHMQAWCLAALADRAVADASSFLSTAR